MIGAIYFGSSPFVDWLKSVTVAPTARERFVKQTDDPRVETWDSLYLASRADSIFSFPPTLETIQTDSLLETSAQSWRVSVSLGRRIELTVRNLSPMSVFVDIYRAGKKRPLSSAEVIDEWSFDYEATQPDQEIQILVQSKPGARGNYQVLIEDAAALHFPVAGKNDRAIQSFWGDRRDGGRRKHKGNDIFASRGTPLLAVTEGKITRVQNGGLGGKTVWLRDGEGRPHNYYYAHLDSQYVRRGQYVERGDTIGTVGNTGNARTTPPHLHFGIYRNGAIDPNAFLRNPQRVPTVQKETKINLPKSWTVNQREPYYLRRSPSSKNNVIRQLKPGETVVPLGKIGRYHRVQTSKGEIGYLLGLN